MTRVARRGGHRPKYCQYSACGHGRSPTIVPLAHQRIQMRRGNSGLAGIGPCARSTSISTAPRFPGASVERSRRGAGPPTGFSCFSPMAQFTVTFEPTGDLESVASLWGDLEGRAEPTFFLSWFWVGGWLRALPDHLDTRLVVVRHDGVVVGLAVLTLANSGSRIPFRPCTAHLHETGSPALDVATIEDNGVLVDRRFAGEVEAAALQWLTGEGSGIQRIVLGGIRPALAGIATEVASHRRLLCDVRNESPRPYVDLDAIRRQRLGYLECLSANTRQSIRRSMRLYEDRGPIKLTVARSIEEAEAFFGRLEALHQAYWSARGRPGAFAYPVFSRLHADLLRTAFAAGAIQLCRVMAGDAEVGYLYNFVWKGWVYAYQSGFHYERDNRLKPGLVSHCLAAEHALSSGHSVYDFMAGSRQHKASLSTNQDRLYWIVIQRPTGVARIRRQMGLLRRRQRSGAALPSSQTALAMC